MVDQLLFPRPRQQRSAIPAVGIAEMLKRAPAGNSELYTALANLGAAYQRVLDGHSRFSQDATVPEAARLVRSARNARAALTPAVAAVRKARDNALGARAELNRRMAKPFDYSSSFADAMLAGEIRAHYARMPEDHRMPALNAALAAKDIVTLRALGAAPAYLSGINPGMHEHLQNVLIDLNPEMEGVREAAAGLDEQAKFAALLEHTVLHSTADLIDFAAADSYAEMAAAATAAA